MNSSTKKSVYEMDVSRKMNFKTINHQTTPKQIFLKKISSSSVSKNFITTNNTSSVVKTLETNLTSSTLSDFAPKIIRDLNTVTSESTIVRNHTSSSLKKRKFNEQGTLETLLRNTGIAPKSNLNEDKNTQNYVKSKSNVLRKMYSNFLQIKKNYKKKKFDPDYIDSKNGKLSVFKSKEFSYKFLAGTSISATNYWFSLKDFNYASYGAKKDGLPFSYGVNSYKGLFK